MTCSRYDLSCKEKAFCKLKEHVAQLKSKFWVPFFKAKFHRICKKKKMQFFQVNFKKTEYSGAIFQGHIQKISRLVITHGKKET